jgi:hypothetical protein
MASKTTKTVPKKTAAAGKGDHAKAATSGPGLRQLRQDPRAPDIAREVQRDQAKALPPIGAKAPEQAKPAKPAKEDKIDRAATIVWLGKNGDKANVARPGSARHERVAKLMAHDGRTVGEFPDAGGVAATLANSIKLAIAKLQ